MDFSFSEEQQEVRDLARKILEDLATNERVRGIEGSEERIDRELWSELGKANLLGVGIGEAYGGSDMGFLTVTLLLQEVGRTVAPVPVLPTLVLAALPIERFGSDAQKRRWLPGVAAGDVILTGALQEAHNHDPSQPSTRATRDGDHWRLEGEKICVPAAHLAERILVPAAAAGGGVGVFLVDPAAPGVTLDRQVSTNKEIQSQLTLSGVAVADDEVLGDPAQGAAIVRWLALHATAACCAVQLGVSERALEMTAAYTSSRVQFGRPIGSFQAVHMRAGDAYIDVEAIRLTAWEAAWRLSQGLPAEDAVEVAKYWAAFGGQSAGYAAQHLHGGIGIDIDYPLHRYYLWAKQMELTLGAAPVQLERIGHRIVEKASASA